MENDVEIFRAWLRKYVKVDKKIKAKDLADKIGIPSPRISQYHSGRVDNGVRTFPNISYDLRIKILEATGVRASEMLEIGRKELESKNQISGDIEERVSALESLIPEGKLKKSDYKTDLEKHILSKHQELVPKFPSEHADIAYEINCNLLELTKLIDNPRDLKEINEAIKTKIKFNKKGDAKKTGTAGEL